MDRLQVRLRRAEARRSTRVVGPAALLMVGALVAAGCSSSQGANGQSAGRPKGSPAQVVLAAAQRTEAADTATMTLRISVSGSPALGGLVPAASETSDAPLSFEITGSGAFDFVHKTGDMKLTIPAKQGGGAQTLELRIIGSDLYLSAPELAGLTDGKSWAHVDAAEYLDKQSQSSGPLAGWADGDPTQVLAMLQKLSGAVTVVGTANVDGVPTTEYQGTIDLIKAGATRSTLVSPQIAQAFGLTDIPIDVWIDGDGRARRVQTSFAFFGITVLAQQGLGGFGAPVTVTAPPAADVADGSSLLQSGQLGNILGKSSG